MWVNLIFGCMLLSKTFLSLPAGDRIESLAIILAIKDAEPNKKKKEMKKKDNTDNES